MRYGIVYKTNMIDDDDNNNNADARHPTLKS